MMILLALLGTAAPAAEWAEISRAELFQMARLVVAGEVLRIETLDGRPAARFRVDRTLKGKAEGDEIRVPFKTETTWACDFKISYEVGKKYLLLIDDAAYYRVVYYPAHTHGSIDSYEGPEMKFAGLALDVMAGVELERRIGELKESLRHPTFRREAFHLLRPLSRATIRPHLAAIREAYGTKVLGDLARKREAQARLQPRMDAEITRDLSLVSEILSSPPSEEAELLKTLSVITGREVRNLATFKAGWADALRRSRVRAKPGAVGADLDRLESADPEVRAAAQRAILEQGPDVLEAVQARAKAADAELRARVQDLAAELELLRDLRSDLEAAASRK